MSCVSSPELADRQLLAYLDGAVDPQVVAHLEQCSHCLEKAQRLARLQEGLTRRLFRLACPAPARLGEYQLGLLPRDQAAALAAHLPDCPHCRREVAQLAHYLADLRADLEFSPLQRVRVLVGELVDTTRQVGRLDSPAPAFAGLRGQEDGPYIYEADGAQLIIEIQEDAQSRDAKVVLGIVTRMDVENLKAHLWRADELVSTTEVDVTGSFVIAGLSPGSYELILGGPDMEFHIQDLHI